MKLDIPDRCPICNSLAIEVVFLEPLKASVGFNSRTIRYSCGLKTQHKEGMSEDVIITFCTNATSVALELKKEQARANSNK